MIKEHAESLAFGELAEDMLARGLGFRFQARGRSMLPAINDGDILHVEPVTGRFRTGDIVLFRQGREFKAHRIVRRRRGLLITRGDAGMETDGAIRAEQVVGRVVARACNQTGRVIRLAGAGARLKFAAQAMRRRISTIAGCLLKAQLLLLLFALFPLSLQAQILVDSASSGSLSVNATGNFSITVSHTTAGLNRMMVVGISMNTTSNSGSAITRVSNGGSGATCTGGTALTRRLTNNTPTFAGMVVEMWYLVAPNTGTANLCVAGNKVGGNRMGVVVGVVTFTGVDQTTPIRASNLATGSSTTASVSVTSSGADMVIDALAVTGGTTVTTPGTQTSQWNAQSGTSGQEARGVGSTRTGAAASVTMSETLGTSTGWTIAAMSLEALNADMSITKVGSPEPVRQGQTLTYTLTVTNNGPENASGVIVLDTLPAEVSFVSVTTTQGTCNFAAGAVSCTLGAMNSGATATITITTTAVTRALAVNSATVAAITTDADLTNNTATWTSTIVSPTAVKLSGFSASPGGGGVLLTWKSAGELHNLGYNVYRESGGQQVRLNPSLIAGSALLMREALEQHGARTYAWVDRAAAPGDLYWLEDVDLNGGRTMHGPIQAQSAIAAPLAMSRTLTIQDLAHPAVPQASSTMPAVSSAARVRETVARPLVSPSLQNVGFDLAANPAVKISVDHEGWYRITQSQLVAAGLDPHADARSLKLYAEGVEQPIRVTGANGIFGPQAAVEFYGTAIDTPFTGRRVYWLTSGGKPGLRISSGPAPGSAGPQPQSFLQTVELKPRTTYFAALLREDTDNFFGPLVSPTADTETLDISNLAPGAGALAISLQGITQGQQHVVTVTLNSATLGDVTFAGQQQGAAQFVIPDGLLINGTNTITLTAQQGASDLSLVDTIDVSFPHSYTAESDLLKFTADAGETVKVDGFAQPPSHVVDITNPLQPVELQFQTGTSGSGFALQADIPWTAAGRHTLLALSDAQLAAPAALELHIPSSLHRAQTGAEFVIISAPQFAAQFQPLADLRRSEGKSVALLSVDAIYDEFNFGEPSPFAIRSFLKAASDAWKNPPRYLLLAGDASVDPRNYFGFGFFDFVPTKIVVTGELKTASDDWFSDFDNTGIAKIATGRLPARTAADAQSMVSKIVGYAGSAPASWNNQSMMVADVDDPSVSFSQQALTVQKGLPPAMNITDVFAGSLGISTARQQLIDGINSGQLLVNYDGHGSVQVWSSSLFDDAMAASLTNGDKLPMFVIMNCLNGFFHDVFTQSLAESLLLAPNGGAVAVWASSGLTQPQPQFQMDAAFVKSLFAQPGVTIGDAALAAKSGIADPDVRKTFILFGDPLTTLKQAQSSTSGPVRTVPPRPRATQPEFLERRGPQVRQ